MCIATLRCSCWILLVVQILQWRATSCCSIDRRKAGAAFSKEFARKYRGKKPVIVSGAIEEWLAVGPKWEEEQFLELFGDLLVKVINQVSKDSTGFDVDSLQHYASIRDYVRKKEKYTEKVALEFNSPLYPAMYPDMQPDIDFLEAVNDAFAFSLGRNGTGNALHQHTENWLTQIKGRKQWILGEPSLPEGPGWSSTLPCLFLQEVAKHPGLQVCHTAPGDTLYIPDGTWHGTCNLDPFTLGVGGRADSSHLHSIFKFARVCDLNGVRLELNKNKRAIRFEVEKGHNVGSQPLHLAAHADCLEVAKHLVSKRANLEAKDKDSGSPPLQIAAHNGHERLVDLLLRSRAQLDLNSWHGTALHRSSAAGHAPIVEMLLKRKAEVVTQKEDGSMPIHNAASSGHERVMELLVGHGAEIDVPLNGTLPLFQAAIAGHVSVVQYMAQVRADLSVRTHQGLGLLHLACVPPTVNLAQYLVRKQGFKANSRNFDFKPLHVAAQSGHAAHVIFLLSQRADIQAAIPDSLSQPLHLAAHSGHSLVVTGLLTSKAPLNAQDGGGNMAVHHASSANRVSVLEILMKRRVDPTIKNALGETPLRVARTAHAKDAISYLRRAQKTQKEL